MSGGLPEFLDLSRAAHHPLKLSGHLRLAALPRLVAVVQDPGDEAAVNLQVFHDGGQVVVQGQVRANLILACQRCFSDLGFPVAADFNLAWVRCAEDVARLPERYEPLLSASGRVKLAELIEDELLLALPMVPLHEPSWACNKRVRHDSPRSVTVPHTMPIKPFAALQALKRR